MKIFKQILCLAGMLFCSALYGQQIIPAVQSDLDITHNTGGMGALDGGDYYGWSISNLGDFDNNGTNDMLVGARLDDDGGSNRGAVYLCFMTDSGYVDSTTKISDTDGGFTAILDDGDQFGYAVENIGDFDGDGITDIAVGAPYDDDDGTDKGAIYVILLKADGTTKSYQKISDTDGDFDGVLGNADLWGCDIAKIGDLDGDGYTDLAVGHYKEDAGGTNRGAIWILNLGSDSKVDGYQKISDVDGNFTATFTTADGFGHAVASVGDIDNDGVPDLLVGAYQNDNGATNAGASYLLFMNTDGTVKSHYTYDQDLDGRGDVLESNWRFGYEVAAAGDVNRDGIPDFAVGAYLAFSNYLGHVYFICPNRDGSVKSYRRVTEGYGWDYTGLKSSSYFSRGIAYMGDINNDGNEDYAINSTNNSYGTVHIMFMDSSATHPDKTGVALDWFKNAGDSLDMIDDPVAGNALGSLGDFTGNGIPDLIVGAKNDTTGGTDVGAIFLYFMSDSAQVDSIQKISDTDGGFTGTLDAGDLFGSSVASIGDVDSDGVTDILVGAPGDDDGGSNYGAAWVLFLNADGTVSSHQKLSDGTGGFDATLEADDALGSSVSTVGDVNGDGIADIAIGAENDDDGGTNRGAVYIAFIDNTGSIDSLQKISDADGDLTTTLANNANFGQAVTNLGDIDDDGNPDIAVGAPGHTGGGAVYILRLGADGKVDGETEIDDNDLDNILESTDSFGAALTSIGDLDGDGYTDIAVGAPNDAVGEYETGGFYLLFLNNTGAVQTYQPMNSLDGNILPCIDEEDYFGGSLAAFGDTDGDGHVEMAVGAYGDDDRGTDMGAIYVFGTYNPLALVDTNAYATLSKKLSGGHYTAQQGNLYFKYEEEYLDSDSLLVFNVYDWENNIVLSQADQPITINYGDNRCYLDMSCSGTTINQGYFILEVINEKKEKWYLRFHNNVICNGTMLTTQ